MLKKQLRVFKSCLSLQNGGTIFQVHPLMAAFIIVGDLAEPEFNIQSEIVECYLFRLSNYNKELIYFIELSLPDSVKKDRKEHILK